MVSNQPRKIRTILALASLLLLAVTTAVQPASAQAPSRITAAIRNTERATLAGSHSPRATAQNDAGAIPAGTRLDAMTIDFNRSPAQETALQTLISAQQNPASPLFRQWLTPDQFATAFGLSDSDIAAVTNWLQTEGFAVQGVNRCKTQITFSGTAAQVSTAFGAELHNYTAAGQTHFAPSADLTIPSALSSVVLSVGNISSFRPRSHVILKPAAAASTQKPGFTSGQSGSHYMTPKDVATIYDINAAYSAGYTGSGQTIAILGQSAIVSTDISNFQTAAGIAVKLPTIVLVPGSGTSTAVPEDETESDLDLEYSSSIGTGATVYFVYTGNSSNYNVINALQYAISTRIASILSLSYGDCEYDTGATEINSLNATLQQATVQGQTVINSSGDDGSTSCYGDTNLSTTLQQQANASYPASSPYVTGLGGTEFTAAAVAASSTYWTNNGTTDVIGSALSYMPEMVWNDDSTSGLSSGGGGISTFVARPTWQTGVPGIPSGSFRLIPDISLDSSPNNAGYLYCSSAGVAVTNVTGSCANGFRDANDLYLTLAGGTSFAAPIFAGMLSIIEQKIGGTGLGNINPTLYTLAANPTTYASAFHDITSGSNDCLAGTAYCSGAALTEYAAGTGYDEATGLGSIDLYNLLTAWPTTTTSTLPQTTTTLSAATASPAVGAADVITITVAPTVTNSTAVTGTVSVSVDGTVVNASLALTGGKATYTFMSTVTGAHTIAATYSGGTAYATSSGSVAVNVVPVGMFTLSATNVTITAGNSGTSTITVTPTGGYTGTLSFQISNSTINNACANISNLTVTGAAASTPLTIYTSAATCNSLAQQGTTGFVRFGTQTSANAIPGSLPPGNLPTPTRYAFILSGLVLAGLAARRNRNLRLFAALILLGSLSVALTGCSDSGTATANSAKGAYTLTVTATDISTSTLTATTTFTVTVQ